MTLVITTVIYFFISIMVSSPSQLYISNVSSSTRHREVDTSNRETNIWQCRTMMVFRLQRFSLPLNKLCKWSQSLIDRFSKLVKDSKERGPLNSSSKFFNPFNSSTTNLDKTFGS
ncbi:unnamed protein product [Trifolium pratense]|uniref:Uncharacterized protein n=1 Tax=Trifolium pratense TaxID=57577 RepID=A0ACB0JMT5_TRIPR|nr:unnamed protein product [Trifolium pratense]